MQPLIKGFIREMHGHAGHGGRGIKLARFFSDFPVTWFLDDPLEECLKVHLKAEKLENVVTLP